MSGATKKTVVLSDGVNNLLSCKKSCGMLVERFFLSLLVGRGNGWNRKPSLCTVITSVPYCFYVPSPTFSIFYRGCKQPNLSTLFFCGCKDNKNEREI